MTENQNQDNNNSSNSSNNNPSSEVLTIGKKENAWERAKRQELEFEKERKKWSEERNTLSLELIDKNDKERELTDILERKEIENKALDKQLWRERRQTQTGILEQEQTEGQMLANSAFQLVVNRTRDFYGETCKCSGCRT